jgi:hypothetical protein
MSRIDPAYHDDGRQHVAPRPQRKESMSHQPPKQQKKKPQHTPKEKKAIKQEKKHRGDPIPLIRPGS